MFWGKPVGRLSADKWPTDGQEMANSRPTVGQQTADSRPTGFFGSSSSQLPICQGKLAVELVELRYTHYTPYTLQYL